MRKIIIIIAKTIGITIAILLILSSVVTVALNIPSVQSKLKDKAVGLLADRFQTHIELDDVAIGILKHCIKLNGLRIDDQRGEHMLTIGEFDGGVDPMALLRGEVIIDEVGMRDVCANIYKVHPDSATNMQFIINALKKKNSPEKEEKDKKPLVNKFEIRKAWLENIRCTYEVRPKANSKIEASLGSAKMKDGGKKLSIKQLKAENNGKTATLDEITATIDITKKVPMEIVQEAALSGLTTSWDKNSLTVATMAVASEGKGKSIEIGNMHLVTDNGKPRKNYGKPNRGAFDAGHLDVSGNLMIAIPQLSKDSVHIVCKHIDATDKASGLIVDSMRFEARATSHAAIVSNISVYCQHTNVSIPAATLLLPDKKESVKKQEFSFSAPVVKASTQLRDIAKPFAPRLSGFTTPLLLTTSAHGNGKTITFDNIRISTPDKRLTIKASGIMSHLNKKHDSRFVFHVSSMHANKGIKEQITNHFPLKKGLLGLLPKIGDVAYSGMVNVWYKHEGFSGKLTTGVGSLDFNFVIDENTKYMKGEVTSGQIAINKITGNNNINDARINAKFNFSIMSGKKARALGLKHGPFPIGEANGTVLSAGYKGIMLHNIDYTLGSDGFAVNGKISNTGKYIDVNCDFSFNDTHNFKNMKLRPSIQFHKKNR